MERCDLGQDCGQLQGVSHLKLSPSLTDDSERNRDGSSWLVTGGAGYIGAHVVRALQVKGIFVAVVDDLSTGKIERLPEDTQFFHGDIGDSALMSRVAQARSWDGIVHLAAGKQARESTVRPTEYWTRNVGSSLALLDFLSKNSVQNVVLSSSCSIFGEAKKVDDGTIPNPVSPYGRTKLVTEQMFFDVANELKVNVLALRYFNVIGNAEFTEAQDSASESLVPSVFRSLAEESAPTIFGNDYLTPDGTCLRDYVDVRDLATAHVLAALYLTQRTPPVTLSLNLASATPTSVLELVNAAIQISGSKLEPIFEARRCGDPAAVWGDSSTVSKTLGWTSRISVKESLQSHWAKVRNVKL